MKKNYTKTALEYKNTLSNNNYAYKVGTPGYIRCTELGLWQGKTPNPPEKNDVKK